VLRTAIAPPVWRGNVGTVAGHTVSPGTHGGQALASTGSAIRVFANSLEKAIKAEFA
jgi:hypothetical protein